MQKISKAELEEILEAKIRESLPGFVSLSINQTDEEGGWRIGFVNLGSEGKLKFEDILSGILTDVTQKYRVK